MVLLLNSEGVVVQSTVVAWTFTYRREKGSGYTRFDGTAEDVELGWHQYWCFIMGSTWCSLDIWPLWPETYGLFEHFRSRLGPPSSGPHHQPVASDLMDSFDEGPILASVWSFPAEERERIISDVEAFLAGR